MEVLDVDRSGSIDLREFKRGLRIGNQQFHASMQKHNESGSNVDHVKKKPEKELTDTEKRMQEVRNRLHKKKSNDSISMV